MIVTIAQRKRMQVDRIRAAMGDAERELCAYASRRGGRFVVFGSAARGDFTYDSDFDLLVDFPSEIERDARDFAEGVCLERGLRPDVHLASDVSEALRERARREGRPLR